MVGLLAALQLPGLIAAPLALLHADCLFDQKEQSIELVLPSEGPPQRALLAQEALTSDLSQGPQIRC